MGILTNINSLNVGPLEIFFRYVFAAERRSFSMDFKSKVFSFPDFRYNFVANSGMGAFFTDERTETTVSVEDLLGRHLVVHNDEVNTFDWVIQSLVEICRHSVEQAEQCAMIIHFKGKYAVRQGQDDTLRPMREALVDRGINATIE